MHRLRGKSQHSLGIVVEDEQNPDNDAGSRQVQPGDGSTLPRQINDHYIGSQLTQNTLWQEMGPPCPDRNDHDIGSQLTQNTL